MRVAYAVYFINLTIDLITHIDYTTNVKKKQHFGNNSIWGYNYKSEAESEGSNEKI